MTDKITYIQHRQSELMNDSAIVGIESITGKMRDSLFDGQRVLESQFLNEMPLLILFVEDIPSDAIHVANNTYLVPEDVFIDMETEVGCFLVNNPFLKMTEKDILEIYGFLYDVSESLLDVCKETFLIGCVQ